MQRKRKDKYRLLKTMITARFLPSLVGFIQSRKARLLFFALSLYLSFSLSHRLTHSLFFSLIWSFAALFMLSFSFHLHFSLCACVLLCIYLSIFRPFESRDLSFPGKLFQENRFAFLHGFVFFFFFSYDSSYDLFTFYDLHIVDLKLHIVFSRLKMWSKPFVSVLRIFISIYFSMKKKSIYIYCVSICILRYFFFFFTYTIYNVDFLFILGYSVSSRLFD